MVFALLFISFYFVLFCFVYDCCVCVLVCLACVGVLVLEVVGDVGVELRTKCDWLTEWQVHGWCCCWFFLFVFVIFLFFIYIYIYMTGAWRSITSIRSHHHHHHRNPPFCSFSLASLRVSNASWHCHWKHCCRRWPRNLWRHDRNRPWPWLP